jgi:hypothetical protein
MLLSVALCALLGIGCRQERPAASEEADAVPQTASEEASERDASDAAHPPEDESEPEETAAADSVRGQQVKEAPVQESSGIDGRVTIGPACPVMVEGEPCPDRPYQAELTLRYLGSGDVAAVVVSDAEGRFRVELPPGLYIVDPGQPLLVTDPQAEPDTVEVEAGRFSQVVVKFDSGVR